jgi:hypothetical protein
MHQDFAPKPLSPVYTGERMGEGLEVESQSEPLAAGEEQGFLFAVCVGG